MSEIERRPVRKLTSAQEELVKRIDVIRSQPAAALFIEGIFGRLPRGDVKGD